MMSKDINLADNLAVACTAQNLLYVTLSLSLPVFKYNNEFR